MTKKKSSNRVKNQKAIWIGIYLTSVLLIGAVALVVIATNRISPLLTTGVALLLIGTVSMTVLCIQSMRATRETQQALLTVQQERDTLREYYTPIGAKIDELDKFRHDIKNYCMLFETAAESAGADTEAICSVAEDISDRLNGILTERLCENNVVNMVVTNKMREALGNGIRWSCSLMVSDSLPFSDGDLCSCFFNLLDNAIEANLTFPEEKDRWISIKAKTLGEYLVIKQENSVFDIPDSEAEELKLITRKRDKQNHGIGLNVLRDIAAKYDGVTMFDVKDGIFISYIYLKTSY